MAALTLLRIFPVDCTACLNEGWEGLGADDSTSRGLA